MISPKGNFFLLPLLLSGSRIEIARVAEIQPEVAEARHGDDAAKLIANGWILDPREPNFVKNLGPLWDLEEGEGYSVTDVQSAETEHLSGNNMDTASSQLSFGVSLNASFNAFSGALATQSQSVTQSSYREQTCIRQTRAKIREVSLGLSGDLTSNLRSSVVDTIMDPDHDARRIVDDIGEFFATSMDLGGIIQSIFSQQVSSMDSNSSFESSVRANAPVWIAQVVGHGNVGVMRNATQSGHDMHVKVDVRGGDAHLWLQHFEEGHFEEFQDAWVNSVPSHLYPIRVRLRPIWDLVSSVDVAKGAAVESYLLQKWQEGQGRLDLLNARPFAPVPDGSPPPESGAPESGALESGAPESGAPEPTPCHPLHNQSYKILVHGWQNGRINRWLGLWGTESWLRAKNNESSAQTFRFEKADECGTYYLQGMSSTVHWLSFTSCGKWMRSFYSKDDAAPLKFHARGDRYIIENTWRGVEQYLSYTHINRVALPTDCGVHPYHSVRAAYSAEDAMEVTFKLQDSNNAPVIPITVPAPAPATARWRQWR